MGRRVLILGGGLVGIEMAEHLATGGRDVVVVELLEEVARDMEMITRKMTLARLAQLPVAIHTATRLVRVEGGEAFIVKGEAPESSLGVFDSILLAVGYGRYDPLSEPLAAAGVRVDVIGDARQPK